MRTSSALSQLNEYLNTKLASRLHEQDYSERWLTISNKYAARIQSIADAALPSSDNTISAPYLLSQLREAVPFEDTIWVVEAVTNTAHVFDQLQPVEPGSYFNYGSSGLGWGGGAALGVALAAAEASGNGEKRKKKLIVQITGDGCFMFGMPSSVYWIGARYNLPVLTIILNNDGMFFSLLPW